MLPIALVKKNLDSSTAALGLGNIRELNVSSSIQTCEPCTNIGMPPQRAPNQREKESSASGMQHQMLCILMPHGCYMNTERIQHPCGEERCPRRNSSVTSASGRSRTNGSCRQVVGDFAYQMKIRCSTQLALQSLPNATCLASHQGKCVRWCPHYLLPQLWPWLAGAATSMTKLSVVRFHYIYKPKQMNYVHFLYLDSFSSAALCMIPASTPPEQTRTWS